MLRDGQYLGAVDGIRDWDVYVAELDRLLAARADAAADRRHSGHRGRRSPRRRLAIDAEGAHPCDP